MINKVEKLILDWLKSDNENATYLADQICNLFNANNCIHDTYPLNQAYSKCRKCGGTIRDDK